MARNLSNEQATTQKTAQFRMDFDVLRRAGVGVVMVRTREAFRAIDALRDYVLAENASASARGGSAMAFKMWAISHGWASFDLSEPGKAPAYDSMSDPLMALRAISPTQGNDTFGDGIFAMMHPHKPLAQSIVMVQVIKEYARAFPLTRKSLVLIMPEGYELPQELQDDVVILDFDVPSYQELRTGLGAVLRGVPESKRPQFDAEGIERILSAGAGMTAHEFDTAVSRALTRVRQALPNVSIDEIVAHVMEVKTEVVRRSEVLEVMEATDIRSIGGLENLKRWISKRAGCFGQEAKDYGIEAPKGIALIGPPGTGKSASAKAIASVLAIPLIKFDIGRVFNSLVGESEKRVAAALKLVEGLAPCVLMIDEVDKAFAGQARGGGGGDSGVGTRVLGKMLTWMQDTTAPVFIVVTANRVENLPSEFLRRGRLDEIFSVSLPHAGERREILRIHLAKRGKNPDEIEGLEEVVVRTEGFVPAEIEAGVKDALVEAYSTKTPLNGPLIASMFGQMVPLSEAFADDFAAMKNWAEQNAKPASLAEGSTMEPPRARSRSRAPAPAATGGRNLNL